ncbi:hypothetical protein LIER_04421 [Lithospermum erythrorhizon]|uniref:Uncharacterized protein n=1 Tax=Lithospermum erythrorhizon TaxID=34254 RepID=A0AAV3NXY2_LITER
MNKVMAIFFWKDSEVDKGIHSKAWDTLCLDKNEGGLGSKDLECMKLALLGKKGRQASLLFKVLKGRYFKRTFFLNAKIGSNPSFGWRSLLEGCKVLTRGVRWRVGDGNSIDVWKDPWVPQKTDFHVV